MKNGSRQYRDNSKADQHNKAPQEVSVSDDSDDTHSNAPEASEKDAPLVLLPFERVSTSKLDTAEACLRHYHWQFAYGLKEEVSPKQEQNRAIGEAIDQRVEDYVKGKIKDVSGAAASVARHYPKPGQASVDTQRWLGGDWAGAQWRGKVDLLTGPSTAWGVLAQPQKQGLIRITDLKSTSDLKWAKTPAQIDNNRQLHMYAAGVWRGNGRPTPDLFEVSQVTVERGAPYRAQAIVRISGREQMLELEDQDRPLVQAIIASHKEEDTLALDPAGDMGVCERWYGYRCAFFERCHGKSAVSVPQSLGALLDADGGRGSAGAGRTIDSIAAQTAPQGAHTQKTAEASVPSQEAQRQAVKSEETMLATPDAAKHQNAKIEGENARYRKTIVEGKSYIALQGDRHGKIWEFRMLGDNWKILVGSTLQLAESAPGFYHLNDGEVKAQGTVPENSGPRMDIVQLRGVFGSFLTQWDEAVAEAATSVQQAAGAQARVSSSSEGASGSSGQPAGQEDDIFGEVEKRVQDQGKVQAPEESRVRELTAVGLTDAQARSLADGGILLEALRAGTVTSSDLTRCKGIGKGTAEKILGRFKKPQDPGYDVEKVKKLEEEIAELRKEDASGDESIEGGLIGALKERARLDPEAPGVVVTDGLISAVSDALAALNGAIPKSIAERITAFEEEINLEVRTLKEQRDAANRVVEELEQTIDTMKKNVAVGSTLSPHGVFVIYVNCRPTRGGTIKEFPEVILPYLEKVAKGKKVRDISQVDPSYLVPGLVNEALHADPPTPCAFVVSVRDQAWSWVRRYFLDRATEIVVSCEVP